MSQTKEAPRIQTGETLRLWLFSVFCLFLTGAVFVYQFLTPSDGARVSKNQESWTQQGIILHVYSREPNGLLEGDQLVAINGEPVISLAESVFIPGQPRIAWRKDTPAVYQVVRDGRIVEVAIQPSRQPLGAIAIEHWGVIIFAVITQVLAVFVFLRRPFDPAARALFIWGMTSSHFYVWSLYRQVPDLINGYGFWLYSFAAGFLWLMNWGAGVHMVLTFPRPLPAVQRLPALLILPYLTTFILYGFFVTAARLSARNVLEWIESWGRSEALIPVILFLPFILIIIHQFRSNKAGPEREKIRLVVFSMLIGSSLTILMYLLPPLLGLPRLDANFVGIVLLLYPASLVVAILRYRLFDIDVIIRRTLVYGILTAALVSIYYTSVILLEQVFRYFTGQAGGSQVVIVLSTLTIATLFNPLRRRIQQAINRRFYRQEYNAEKVLADLSTTLRDEVDLDRLTSAILAVVEETVQPVHVSLLLPDAGLQLGKGTEEGKLSQN